MNNKQIISNLQGVKRILVAEGLGNSNGYSAIDSLIEIIKKGAKS